jgi:hypothetical protein
MLAVTTPYNQLNDVSRSLPEFLPAAPHQGLYELLQQDVPGANLEDYLLTTRYDNVLCLSNVPETASLEPQLILGAPEYAPGFCLSWA